MKQCEHEWRKINTIPCRLDEWCCKCGTLRFTHFAGKLGAEEDYHIPENMKGAEDVYKELDNIRALEQPNYVELEKRHNGRLIRAMWIAKLALSGEVNDSFAMDVLSDELFNAMHENGLRDTVLFERWDANK